MTRPFSPLVSAEQLATRMDDGEPLVVLDVSWQLGAPSQRPLYDAAHLPGAAWVDFEEALSAQPGDGGRHPMPDIAVFQAAMRAAGVDNESPVVVYDRSSSLAASRCWWLLEYCAHERVQVLDGGFGRWSALGLPVSDEAVRPRPGNFVATPPGRDVLDADGAAEYADRAVLLDARPADRFRGENETIDPVAGHIPGAVSAPALANLQEDGRFLPADDLAMRFTSRGVTPHCEVGVYCGSGVQAMHTALALDASGLGTRSAVYVGSWSHWITDPDRAVAAGTPQPAPGD
ncbi:sulfurtransferase [Luteipulveratus sp. YIM 133132]|uniref:sulfurtransferase n=1 Tax=Luteipulveratus flavus TaxID=3031728 RepID=UPI0023B0DAFB|nr:sulfurtransferase [Luteipulveratus sp. YIM 133132]MDE9367540.1 sulfurtransferase [Luteipulveratus sp. YIM 133132]